MGKKKRWDEFCWGRRRDKMGLLEKKKIEEETLFEEEDCDGQWPPILPEGVGNQKSLFFFFFFNKDD